MPFNRLRRWNHPDEHVYSTYDETFASESISSKDTHSHSSSSDGGISSGRESWMSSQTNVYDQICYDAIQTTTENNLTAKYEDRSPPYTPSHLSDDAATEHYYYRLPTPSSINEIISSKSSRSQQTNSKKELHKELAHRQKMGQLLPKKPELLNVFKHRREEEKKREEERSHEQTKLEQILARQRQKLEEIKGKTNKKKKIRAQIFSKLNYALSMQVNISISILNVLLLLFSSSCSGMMMRNPMYEAHPCDTCREIGEKFIEGYRKTAGSNFGGGNTDWEEKKLKGYAKSETRFIEIMEIACSKSESQCSTFLEKYEDLIEEWYRTSLLETIDTFTKWLCIDTAKVCCPQGTFGKNCRRCHHGDNGLLCSGNGLCDGDGKRSGNGRCLCNTKYSGTNCSNCQSGYTKSVDANNQIVCTDIDECRTNFFFPPCGFYKCNNTDGRFECYGEPFYLQSSKMSLIIVLFITTSILMYKDMQNLALLTCILTAVLVFAFSRNIL
ncbi:unnamed protein product [Adineta ricciae]|uniref:EGF-like domain-containing protein n=1 Tax=Adineta ricciae TaxID=249248 RepID=A0A814M077_ADIRI|nr:unnamed protein product [Adineta ricciae]